MNTPTQDQITDAVVKACAALPNNAAVLGMPLPPLIELCAVFLRELNSTPGVKGGAE